MLLRVGNWTIALSLSAVVLASTAAALSGAVWHGVLRDRTGGYIAEATIHLREKSGGHEYSAKTTAAGDFAFSGIAPGKYQVSVDVGGKSWTLPDSVAFKEGALLTHDLQLSSEAQELRIVLGGDEPSPQATGGEHLSSGEVSSLPLNARDFSKLLLLAAGTMTDANGAANFTQQYAVNGQRGSATVFAVDGFDTTDPEMGGATFSNFNVDAIQEVQGNAGVMPAEIGHGAAAYTNVVSKAGVNQVHGSFFEFIRNASFDARNYFDHTSDTDHRRIPPFVRNEFGFTNGGPLVLPKIYNGRSRTFYFGEYQGFRQVLGTTQVIPVPTADERQGIDRVTFPGDVLTVPVNPAVLPILNGYPLPE